ncbi:hypothetical protein K144313037_p10240 (plasmid) [Clostridium tetani]|nr:hypothetical protein C3B72_13475 [Clostridium tetani]KGI43017.1 hypothetical protein KY55_08255 [Clostridium tetani]RXI44043.1 hypothetical protein DP126_12630 [Clostridium tetani]RXI67452.1 hypothetical protein DP127_14240 [Clostridium tetani]RXI78865.1 hypothetical protein DP128_00405 [Clostridium tetani]
MIFSFKQICIVSVIITLFIDYFFINYIKSKDSISNLLFGNIITIIGLFKFHLVYNETFYTTYGNVIPYFIATYLITTGLFLSITGYIKNSR